MRRIWHMMLMMIFGALLIGCGGPGIADTERAERGSALYRKAIAAEQAGYPVEVVLDEVFVRPLVVLAELPVYAVALRNELCYNVRAPVVPVIFVEVPEGLLELAGLDEYHLQNLRRDGFRRTGVLVGTMCFRHCFVPFAHPGS